MRMRVVGAGGGVVVELTCSLGVDRDGALDLGGVAAHSGR
jgi:hypothetical protein